ncbi:hypothetical protein HSX11_13560 [Oxalobacteraceae bacterium]|nr:hypothetical protein [Oxalobacteraceae bacterium]
MLKLNKIFSAFTLLWLSMNAASACKLGAAAYDLQAFLEEPGISKVVFVGKVASVSNVQAAKGLLVDQRIEFAATRWWHGAPRASVTGRGKAEKPLGTDCDGNWNFLVSAGDEWLIIGYEQNGLVHPSGLLSRKLINGTLPKEEANILNGE